MTLTLIRAWHQRRMKWRAQLTDTDAELTCIQMRCTYTFHVLR